ncbi:GEVED domain-containing protein [Flavobacterium sp. Sd200]|uniref:GEVED domain-containing protein n=1 Tax=Flavobacterium sp. Sd200 TaxID=2692211 RepID=UPI0013715DB7|nr:GEVED domain-containing protein [Flavobacterium sp. Sd200]
MAVLFITLFNSAFAQTDSCASAPTLTVGTSCTTTNYNVTSTFTDSGPAPTCTGTSYRDGWYKFTTSATQNIVTITATSNRVLGLAIYSGSCSGTSVACTIPGTANATLVTAVLPSTTYYLRLMRTNNSGSNNMTGTVCVTGANGQLLTYSGGNAGTLYTATEPTASTATLCPVTLTANVPAGYWISGIKAYYSMTSVNAQNAYVEEQRSLLYSPTLSAGESTVTQGVGDAPGTYNYERNITFANYATGNVDIQLRSWRTWGGNANSCNSTYAFVVNNSYRLIVSYEPIPSCGPVIGTTAAITSSTSANISWSAPTVGSPTGYQYAVTTSSTAPSSGTVVTATSVSGVTITPNATNYVWVRSDCSGTYSSWTSYSFYAGYCTPAPASVDGSGLTNVTIGTINNTTGAETGNYGDYSAQVVNIGQGVAQPFSLTFSTDGLDYNTKIWIDWNNDYDFNDAGEEVFSGISTEAVPSTLSGTFTVPLTASLGNHRLRIGSHDDPEYGALVPCYVGTYGSYEDYTVNVTPPPTCFVPTGLTVTSNSATSATISWTASASSSAVSYQYAYSTTNDVSGATTNTTTSLSASVTGLAPNQTYYVWVRTNCGVTDGYSEWAAYSFYNGYCIPSANDTSAYIANFTTTGGITNVANTTTASAGGYGNYTSQVISQVAGDSVNYSASFGPSGETLGFAIWVDWNNDLDFNDSGEQVFVSSTYGTAFSGAITIPAGTPLGNYRVRVLADYWDGSPDSACSFYNDFGDLWGEAEDYTIAVVTPPSCYVPTALAASFSGTTGAFSWAAPSLGTAPVGYEYVLSTTDATPTGSGTAVSTTSFSDTVTLNTTYYLYVRSNCGSGDYSTWASASFYTGYCTPSSNDADYYIANFTTTGGLTNVANATAYSVNGYGNYTSQVISQAAGGAVNFTTSFGASASDTFGFGVWIDWNNDYDFNDAGEQIFISDDYESSFSGIINVPVGTPIGNYRMRILADYLEAIPNSCSIYNDFGDMFGEGEDYTFAVVSEPTCYAPTALSALFSGTTGTFSWTAPAQGTTPAGYEYVLSTTAGTPTGSGTSTATTSFVSTVALNTNYYLYVRTDCGSGDFSAWAQASFYTGYCAASSTGGNAYRITAFSTTGGVANITNTGNGYSAGGYGNFTAQSASNYQGAVTNFAVTTFNTANTYGVNIWIDWNDDYFFSDSERVYASAGYVSSPTGSFTVPATAAVGNHRLRLRSNYWEQNPSACGVAETGETEDYTFTVLAPCYTWTGATSTAWATPGNWCGGLVPTATSNVTIANVANAPVIAAGTIATVHNLTVSTGASLTVNSGATLSVDNILITNGAVTVQNNGALIQGASATVNNNNGEIIVVKNSNPLFRLDYILWSSPVSGTQTLGEFSPQTTVGRFYEYGIDAGVEQYLIVPPTTTFTAAKGYLIRMPNGNLSVPGYNAGSTSYSYIGSFVGTPNNGNVSILASTAGDRYTAVGNPYPSPISVVDFFNGNSGVIDATSSLYFWRKKNNSATSSYASLNLTGFTANQSQSADGTGGQGQSGFYPNSGQDYNLGWIISQGQGFFVQTKSAPTATHITFTNSMRRSAPTNGQQSFFRTGAPVMSRYWLNLTDTQGGFSQALVAYSENTTMGLDYGYDGKMLNDGGRVALYSVAEATNLSIQARSSFTATDVVPMGFTALAAGQYTIAIDRKDGLFDEGQEIYLKDNLLGTVTSLEEAYTFTSEAGTFNGRFEVVYAASPSLGDDDHSLNANSVMVFKQGNGIAINTGSATMKSVTIYDIRGRQLYTRSGINATETVVSSLQVEQQVLIVEVDTVKGKVSKRIIF